MKVYLAGPEVFYADAHTRLARKRELAVEFGLQPVLGELGDLPSGPVESGLAIFRANEKAMRAAAICVANISPFRGLSADPGTVWELGFMYGLGRRCFAYTSEPRHYTPRVAEWVGEPLARDPAGLLRLPNGAMVEEHEMADNLMIDGSLILSGMAPHRAVVPGDEEAAYIACLQQIRSQVVPEQKHRVTAST
jgi:nucleoside 2-deoxyribosyltransferase